MKETKEEQHKRLCWWRDSLGRVFFFHSAEKCPHYKEKK